jgi:hypothetical protein
MPHVHHSHRSGPSSRRDRPHHTAQRWRVAAAVAAVLLMSALLDACGSSSSTASHAAVEQTCKQIEAVLSDGPEPAADPVGYAQAQVLPLREIRTSDRQLHDAVYRLAAAYQAFSTGARTQRAASTAVTAAAHGVDAICPGAAS